MASTTEKIGIQITADGASVLKVLDQVESKSKSVGSSLKSGFLAASAAVASIAGGVTVALKAYQSQEKQEQKIRATLEATGKSAEISAKQVFALASEYQNLTGVGDDVVLQGQAILLAFKNVSAQALPRATEGFLDLAAIMQTDAKSAALQLGKALNDPAEGLSALSRAGVSFSATEKQLVKQLQEANKFAEAQEVIFNKLDNSITGTARQMAQGTGIFTILGQTIGDVAETAGKILAPEFVQLAHTLNSVLLSLQNNADTFENYKAIAIASTVAIGTVISEYFQAVAKGYAAVALIIKGALTLNKDEVVTGLKEIGNVIGDVFGGIGEKAGAAYGESLRKSIERRAQFDAAQEQIAKVKTALDNSRTVELDALESFKKKLKALEEENVSLAALQNSPELQRNLVAAQLANDRLNLQIANDERELKQQVFQNEQKRILELDYQKARLDLKDEIFQAEFEANLTNEQLIEEQRLEFELRRLEINNQARKDELAAQEGYYFANSRLTKEQQTKILAETGTFGKALLKVESTLSQDRLNLAGQTFGNLQELFNNFGLKNTAANKALQIAQVAIQGFSSAFQTYATVAGEIGGIPGIVAGGVAAGIVAANAGFAISKIVSQRYNPKGLAGGSSGLSGASLTERYVSTFSQKEIVVPERFSAGIRKGDLVLSGPGAEGGEAMPGRDVQIEVGFTQDAGKILQILNNENAALGVLPAT